MQQYRFSPDKHKKFSNYTNELQNFLTKQKNISIVNFDQDHMQSMLPQISSLPKPFKVLYFL